MKKPLNNAIGPQVRGVASKKKKLVPILAILSIIAGLQTATQYFAYYFNYSYQLGPSLCHLYQPWAILIWWQKWYHIYPKYFMTAGSIGMVATSFGFIVCFFIKMHLQNSAKANPYLHGSAQWASKKDILAAGLLGNDKGAYVGAWKDEEGVIHYLRHNGPEHILTFAPTRSGKGLGLVLPTLLSWPDSVIITDLKGELWAMTSGWRQKYAKNKVIRFEPASPDSACLNPLEEIRIGTQYEVGDVQNLATLVTDPDGKGLETHWQKTSQALLVGLILHVLYKLKVEGFEASFPNVDKILSSANQSVNELLTEMTKYPHFEGKTHSVVSSAAMDMIERPEEEAGSVLSTLKSYLALYRDPIVAANVSRSDFRIKDLMHHDSPVSLYIVTQPNDKTRLQPLVRLVINMIVRLLADKMEFERISAKEPSSWVRFFINRMRAIIPPTFVRTKKIYKHRLLGMIDEFPSLGKLDILQESLAFVAGYGIKFYLICQDINQLKSREKGYGPDESITSNCHIQNSYPPNRIETADHLSKLSGQTTVIKEQITTSGRRWSLVLGQVSKTTQEVQRALLTSDECIRMPGPKKNAEGLILEAGDMLIYINGFPMIYGKQPLYFEDPIFVARAAVAPPSKSDRLRDIQNTKEIIL